MSAERSRRCVHCKATENLAWYRQRTGERVSMCKDGIACARRRMGLDGVRLLPHPKNP